MKLTNENYYTLEANQEYWSCSQFKDFEKCEEFALKKIRGEITTEPSPAMLVGSYVDAFLSGELDDFIDTHKDKLYTKQGTLRADFRKAEEMIERIKQDPYFMQFCAGNNQTILTGTIAGCNFKAKCDCIRREENGRVTIVDYKCMKDLSDIWDDRAGCKRDWINYYQYDTQLAIYRDLVAQHGILPDNIDCYLAVITKGGVPDLHIIHIDNDYLDQALVILENKMDRYDLVKRGLVAPLRCDECDYCKATRRLDAAKIEEYVPREERIITNNNNERRI